MHVLITIVVGLVVGVIARLVMPSGPGRERGGVIATLVLGVAGAFVVGMLGHALGWYAAGESPGIVASILGAVVVLAIHRAVSGRRVG